MFRDSIAYWYETGIYVVVDGLLCLQFHARMIVYNNNSKYNHKYSLLQENQ